MNSTGSDAGGVRVSVGCQAIIARAVDDDQLKRTAPRSVRLNAFMPRKNGKDNDGLSVTVVQENTLKLLRQNLGPKKEAVTLHVGHVGDISANGHRLDVHTGPLETDPNHALIKGFPHRGPDETTQNKAIWNRLAERLAAHARCCLQA